MSSFSSVSVLWVSTVYVCSLLFPSTQSVCMYHYSFLSPISSLSFSSFLSVCCFFSQPAYRTSSHVCVCFYLYSPCIHASVCTVFKNSTVFSSLLCECISVLRYAGSHSHRSKTSQTGTFHSFQQYLEAVNRDSLHQLQHWWMLNLHQTQRLHW